MLQGFPEILQGVPLNSYVRRYLPPFDEFEPPLGVELDDLGIVVDESDRTTEWGAGEFVAVEIDVPPLHRVVEFRFSEITVAEKLPLGEKDYSTTAPKLSTQTFEFLDEIRLFDEDDTAADEDQLSALPNKLKLLNLFFLADESNTRDVIWMSAVSRGWGNLWSSVPYLHFRDVRIDLLDAIDNTLRQYLGRKLERFNVHYNLDEPHHKPNVDSWISFAADARVENLSLTLFKYVLPLNFYTNSLLCELSLNGFLITLEEGISVNWNSLVQLDLRDMSFGVGVIRDVLKGTPKLHTMKLLSCIGVCNIISEVLNTLIVIEHMMAMLEPEIVAPNK
nr:isoform 2 of putative f-box protein [Quercus suber]